MDCPLVMIEWEDSAQPIARWQFLSDLELPGVVRCVSVGWLVRDDQVKALAPNMGAIDDEAAMQASGIIQIPESCVIKVTKLREPKLTSYPSSRPAKARKLPAS